MRRPTFAFGAVESPRCTEKSRCFNGGNTDGSILIDSISRQGSSCSDSTYYEGKSTSIAECASSKAIHPSNSGTSLKLECGRHAAKNQFCNADGYDLMLVPAVLPCSTPDEYQKPRKRKERQDSASSITQERKLVRSNSEERPIEEKKEASGSDIRRVVSHEDFLPLHEHNTRHTNIKQVAPIEIKQANRAINEVLMHGDLLKKYPKKDHSPARSRLDDFSQRARLSPDGHSEYSEDADHEGRRHTERFSRARIPQTSSRKASSSTKIRRTQRTSRPAANLNLDGNENVKPISSEHFYQKECESLTPENKHAPFPWSEPCDFRPVPSLHVENFRIKKLNLCENNFDPASNTSSICKLRKSEEAEDVVRMTECHARKYEYHSKALSENNSVSSNSTNISEYNDSSCLKPSEERLKQISKKLAGLKKRIAKYEEAFESQNGYRMSQSDKMGDKNLKKIYGEIQKLRKEKVRLQIDPNSSICYGKVISNLEGLKTDDSAVDSKLEEIKHCLREIEKRLQDKRDKCNRPTDLEQMSPEQLSEEKVALQKALLYLEAKFGRPTAREERDLAHPLYDRYRQVKRFVLRSHMSKLNSSINELETILEHETMDFISSDMSSQPSNNSLQQQTLNGDKVNQLISTNQDLNSTMRVEGFNSDKLKSPNRSIDESPPSSLNSTDSNSTSTSSMNENFHHLPLHELKIQLTVTQEEKKQLRRSIKEFEHDFETKTGRRLQKEDRISMETTYGLYKQIKAKLRLLEALVNKQKPKCQ